MSTAVGQWAKRWFTVSFSDLHNTHFGSIEFKKLLRYEWTGSLPSSRHHVKDWILDETFKFHTISHGILRANLHAIHKLINSFDRASPGLFTPPTSNVTFSLSPSEINNYSQPPPLSLDLALSFIPFHPQCKQLENKGRNVIPCRKKNVNIGCDIAPNGHFSQKKDAWLTYIPFWQKL